MDTIQVERVQQAIDSFLNKDTYIHLETTTGSYANHKDEKAMTVSAFIRNSIIRFERGSIKGDNPYRIGLKTENGWVYAQGITHFEIDSENRLLMAGHNGEGQLAISLELSLTPFN